MFKKNSQTVKNMKNIYFCIKKMPTRETENMQTFIKNRKTFELSFSSGSHKLILSPQNCMARPVQRSCWSPADLAFQLREHSTAPWDLHIL